LRIFRNTHDWSSGCISRLPRLRSLRHAASATFTLFTMHSTDDKTVGTFHPRRAREKSL
jgi:hypothetical protein